MSPTAADGASAVPSAGKTALARGRNPAYEAAPQAYYSPNLEITQQAEYKSPSCPRR